MIRQCWSLVMHTGSFLSSMPRHYCSNGLRVEPLFHVEAGLYQALLRGITVTGRPHMYSPGILPTHLHTHTHTYAPHSVLYIDLCIYVYNNNIYTPCNKNTHTKALCERSQQRSSHYPYIHVQQDPNYHVLWIP